MTFFFLQTTILTLIGPLFTILNSAQSTWGQVRPRQTLLQRVPPFIFHFFKETYKTGRAQRVPLWIFSELCDFFSKFFFRKFFFRKQNGMFFNKSRRVPPFTFFGTMRLLLKENFFSKISIFFPKKVFYAFWALDMAPTFFLQTTILTLIGPLFRNNPETT